MHSATWRTPSSRARGWPRSASSRSAPSARYQEAVKISTQRYKAGKASYFEVLQAQQLLFPAEVTLAEARRDEFIAAVVQLYKALGGGWNVMDPGGDRRHAEGKPPLE